MADLGIILAVRPPWASWHIEVRDDTTGKVDVEYMVDDHDELRKLLQGGMVVMPSCFLLLSSQWMEPGWQETDTFGDTTVTLTRLPT